jgi:hypothetical protein
MSGLNFKKEAREAARKAKQQRKQQKRNERKQATAEKVSTEPLAIAESRAAGEIQGSLKCTFTK